MCVCVCVCVCLKYFINKLSNILNFIKYRILYVFVEKFLLVIYYMSCHVKCIYTMYVCILSNNHYYRHHCVKKAAFMFFFCLDYYYYYCQK